VEPASTLTNTGATTGDYNDPVTLSAKLTATIGGAAIIGKTVQFTSAIGSCSGVTNASGTASCTTTPLVAAGAYPVTATFASDAQFAGSSVTFNFTVTLEESQLVITGPLTSDYHDAVSVKAQLTDPVAAPRRRSCGGVRRNFEFGSVLPIASRINIYDLDTVGSLVGIICFKDSRLAAAGDSSVEAFRHSEIAVKLRSSRGTNPATREWTKRLWKEPAQRRSGPA
jgi:Big-like domain-containing protein